MLIDDEDNLFHDAMQGVQPLNQDSYCLPTAKKPVNHNIKRHTAENYKPTDPVFDYEIMDQSSWVSGDDKVYFHKTGVNLKMLKQLKLGKIRSEASLDLHFLTAGQAITATDDFLEYSINSGYKVVTIIHGKGYKNRDSKPILKNLIVEHLRNNLFVLAYHSTQPREGGTGALKVLLKSASKVL